MCIYSENGLTKELAYSDLMKNQYLNSYDGFNGLFRFNINLLL